ncbi:hypothetical protein A6P39_041415 [Streptomyces sp. FXJ1.172]|uniref:hypothetical protein n=1 Tax=Streptomyces sp. FXJ1.172 TaxID=710705 RepID=UPI0007D02842|nr:hypothetical protein [Streptomyces sp. FXJ1.172]WEO99969.1 hypothetical protein A6P39_041415 [Streptomyces sp. FXJ1.172]
MRVRAQGSSGPPGRQKILDVYLNDHLAGATGGTELIRRMAVEHRDSAYGSELKALVAEISQDRRQLLRLLADLDVAVSHYKVYGAWLGEKIRRVKPNGRLLHRSGLTLLVELEAMRLGVQGKVLLWRALLSASAQEPRLDTDWLERLLHRAEQQLKTLDSLHARAATELLSAVSPRVAKSPAGTGGAVAGDLDMG